MKNKIFPQYKSKTINQSYETKDDNNSFFSYTFLLLNLNYITKNLNEISLFFVWDFFLFLFFMLG